MLLLSCECWEHVAFHLSWKDAFEIYVSSVAMASFSQGKRHRVKREYIRIALAARDPPQCNLTDSEQRLRRLELADIFPAACLCGACQYHRWWQWKIGFVRDEFGGEPAQAVGSDDESTLPHSHMVSLRVVRRARCALSANLVKYNNLASRCMRSPWSVSSMSSSDGYRPV